MRFLDQDDADDPILSVVNLIDLFLVVIGILMIVIVRNPLNRSRSGRWSWSRTRARPTCASWSRTARS